ncbi:MAG: hypothetical protein E7A46_02050 [Finegoldia magna]|uniref:hypothetical protein n=1 Tax=Finegoldia magna TaxID=1260 RepID=UPI0028FF1402|nr:hypothetical protein [Finegoldia magna]MDU1010484.1 hypothetical protein [Finegoldia magna]MDU1086894.1 hypothetical protein [Finegoldia magna]
MENRANIPILRKIIFGIVVSILLLATIASIFLMVNHAAGSFVEGMMGFVCEIVFRVFFIVLFFLVLLMSHFIKEKRTSTIIWWICAICYVIGSFFVMKAPIEDLSYINSPSTIKLTYVTFEEDNNYELSTFYKLTGYTQNDEIQIFDLNWQTYKNEKEKWNNNENISADITYLPHTNVLMKLNTHGQQSSKDK